MPVTGEDPRLARNLAGVRLTLETGGKFQLVEVGLPFSGSWRRTGDVLTLDVETFMERSLSTQPETTRKAAAAFSGKIVAESIDFTGLSGSVVRLKRVRGPT